ncbi:heterokaryon incompatibility protein-domain-containing protein [Xylariaceae sp. FL1651]|nr:heterokaryon incompatibility protein-domain-containing protein [Xylariaceae sp. FL1651]
MAALKYTYLGPSKKQIRLLTLMKGEWDEMIECGLHVTSLDDQPKYEALSYAWGSVTDCVDIHINGIALSVTRNLFVALRRLRERMRSDDSTKDSRTLWVDAVCINQQDTDEKRYQVELMGDIYSQTARGLLWLGEEPDEPQPTVSKEQEDEVMRKLEMADNVLNEISARLPHLHISEDLTPMPEVKLRPGEHDFKITRSPAEHWDPQFNPGSLDDAGKLALEADSFYQVNCLLSLLGLGAHLGGIAHLQHEPDDVPATFRTNTRKALHWLGTRPWWHRIWTVQECILPRDSDLLYGPIRIPWGRFLAAILNFQKHRTSCCADVPGVNDMLNGIVETVLPCDILYRYCHHEDFKPSQFPDDHESPFDVSSLFRPESLLWTFRHREATDPRDKIYGILSLLKGRSPITGQSARTLIVPNYSPEISFETVFTRAVYSIIQFSASLDIICQQGDIIRSPDLKLPSWVPDFSQSVMVPGSLDRYLRQITCYDACAKRSASPSVIEENIMVLEGCLVDTIASTSGRMVYSNEEPIRSVLKKWYEFSRELHSAVDGNDADSRSTDWKERFWRTLCGDTIMTRQRVPLQEDYKAPLRRIPAASSSAVSTTHEETAYNLWCRAQGLDSLGTEPTAFAGDNNGVETGGYTVGSVAYAIRISTTNRKFFSSTKGHFGLGPPMCGLIYPDKDRIFVFPGGKTPFVLRYVGMRHLPGLGMQPCHQLLGDCYLDGAMDGEGIRDFETNKQTVYIV